MFLELAEPEELHPQYGRCEYREILQAFRSKGFTVISEIRARNTDVDVYAGKIVRQVDSLLKSGVPASHITVVGTSKGAYIAWLASALLKNNELNFVLLGICNEQTLKSNKDKQLCGNILSIYERSDDIGKTCASLTNHSACIPHFREIELDTGLKHGFLFKALDGWLTPAIEWAKGNYQFKQ